MSDLVAGSRSTGTHYTVLSCSGGERIVMEGQLEFWEFHSGLTVHATNLVEIDNLETRVALAARMSVTVLLEGAIDATFDGQEIRIDAKGGANGMVCSNPHDSLLVRRSNCGTRVRKVVVTVPPDWFGEPTSQGSPLPRVRQSAVPVADKNTVIRWTPSFPSISAAEEIIASAGDKLGLLDRIQVEVRAMQILREAMAAVVEDEETFAAKDIDPRDAGRAYAARSFIQANWSDDLTLSGIARQTGMSVTTLQRTFRQCHGVPVMTYLRIERLDRARQAIIADGLSVGAAARLAGYSSAENFTTAFRRQFGYPPSMARRAMR